MKLAFVAITVIALGLPGAAYAQSTDHASHHPAGATSAPVADALADGEVRRVDKDAKKITLRHGPIPGLDMPPMTMVFQVKDPALLDQVKAGDKVRFAADKIGSAYTVTRIELVK